MASSYTPRLVLPEMADGEGSGYVTFNELARILDMLQSSAVESRTVTDPPGSPADGQIWLVPPAGATGAWAGQENKVAQWYNGAWYFWTPVEGYLTRVKDEDAGEGRLIGLISGGVWEEYLTVRNAVDTFTFTAYGGMYVSVPTAFPNLGAGWQHLNVFDTLSVATPRGIIPDTGADTMTIENEGVYALAVSGALAHNELNGGREFYIRLYNVSEAAPVGAGILVPTGRNSPGTPINVTVIFEITAALEGDVFRLEIGNGDAYSSVEVDSLEWSLFNIGEWRKAV